MSPGSDKRASDSGRIKSSFLGDRDPDEEVGRIRRSFAGDNDPDDEDSPRMEVARNDIDLPNDSLLNDSMHRRGGNYKYQMMGQNMVIAIANA